MSPDPYRLPTTVIPSRYDLRLEPDLVASVFTGEVVITVVVKEPLSEIVLNAAELEISHARIVNPSNSESLFGYVTVDGKTERCSIFPSATITPGKWQLRLPFKGTLNDKLRGFYRSK